MKMSKQLLTYNVSTGYISLQIPELILDTDNQTLILASGTMSDVIDMPDEWFMRKYGSKICIGKRTGVLYFSRKGYNANKDLLKTAFEEAIQRGHDRIDGKGWKLFEQKAEEFFSKLSKSVAREEKHFNKMLKELQDFKKNLEP